MILIDPTRSRRGFSRISRAMQCGQKYAHERFNSSGLRSTGTQATNKGTLIGLGIGHWYAKVGAWQGGVVVDSAVVREAGLTEEQKAKSLQPSLFSHGTIVTDPELFLDPVAAMQAACDARPELSQWLDLSAHAVSKYVEFYQREMDTVRVLAVEVEHELIIGTLDCPGHGDHGQPLWYTGRVDFVLSDAIGRVSIIDTKTSGSVTANASKYYSRHGQFFGLEMLGVATYGQRFDGAKLNMVQTDGQRFERPAMKPRPWAIGNYRERLVRKEHEIAALEIRTREYWEELRARAAQWGGELSDEQEALAAKADLTSWNWPAADHELSCFTRYGLCEYASFCDWGPAELGSVRR